MTKRNKSTPEERALKVMSALFIMQAAQLGMSGGQMRKILGVAMNDVSPTLKSVNNALKKARKIERYG